MTRLVRFPLEDGGSIVVEVDEAVAGPVRAAKPGEVIATAGETFERAVAGLRPVVEVILRQLRDLGPETVTVELGVKFGGEAGVILAKSTVEAACKVTLAWKKG
jgi:hypothetical protein